MRGVVRVYLVLEGDQQVYTKGESEVASFRIDADFSLFEEYGSIYIDEQLLSSDSYRAEYGSTIISLKKAYMDSLAAGQHLFTAAFGDFGMATAKFTVVDSPDTPDTPDIPDTPDSPDTPDTPDTPDSPDTPDTPDTPEQSNESDVVVPNTSHDKTDELAQNTTNQKDTAAPNTGSSSENGDEFALDPTQTLVLAVFIAPVALYVLRKRSIRHRKF